MYQTWTCWDLLQKGNAYRNISIKNSFFFIYYADFYRIYKNLQKSFKLVTLVRYLRHHQNISLQKSDSTEATLQRSS